jgi:ABC-2 type transport system permease protein
MPSLANIFWLGTKELRSFVRDYVLVGLVIWAFSLAVYAQAQSRSQELFNAAIAIIDEDDSPLSHYVIEGFYLPPYFRSPQKIALRDVNRLMDNGTYTFILDIPLHFERDVLAGRQPAIQINVDATVMVQAGIGAGYIQQILTTQINDFLARSERAPPPPVSLDIRVAFNPNVTTS